MLCKCLFLCLLAACTEITLQQDEDIPHHEVKNWALKFGVDLWEFGRQFTKLNEIQKKYHDFDVQISRKDGLILIRELAAEVKNMMDIKMNALMRIMDSAEQAALPQKFDSSSPKYFNSKDINSPKTGSGSFMEFNKHFDHSYVNTSFSVVIVPNKVKETDPKVLNSLKWSEHLDPVFVNNYEMDPGLSWQYFGSSSGFLRRFPAMKWPSEEYTTKDLDDFRTNLWFVNAATSPKDIVILLDTSKSMSGKTRDLAHATVRMILDTLGANDFVNIFKFSETTQEILPCYKDLLVQGTDENKNELKQALGSTGSSGVSNFTAAFVTAFEILHKYNRTRQGCQCNQAIMLISDGPSSNLKDVFQMYNFPHMPVRVFTYLVGKDASNAKEMLWMACANKGYFEHIKDFDEIRERVLNYILVMARPMVMYQQDHPVSWTPAYPGGKANSLVNSLIEEGQLMTTVSTPVFDRRNYSVRTANLLGVVGTDVPIQQIKKLVPPYRLGVNGYSFIVNNNGHVLYHPELLTVPSKDLYMEKLKPRYSNVDLLEVELVDSEGNLFENNTLLFDLRHDMIDQKEGETEFKIKVHYNDMRRVTTRRHKYFYHPIEGTPFSLGLALPDGYGLFEVNGEREIKLDPANVTEYFKGKNWKVHPEWVYCEYNYANYMNFKSPEEQVLHFLTRTKQPGWKWMSLRPRAPQRDPGLSDVKKMEHDSYFCDKTLMQSLVLDALVTDGWERPSLSTLKEEKQQGYQMFGVTLTFIATRSGLLRWQDHSKDQSESGQDQIFSENNRKAIDETWYKRAVDQHTIEPESFVFSVPFNARDDPKTLVTATHAVFVESKGHRAPAAVVGLQFQHSSLASHFKNITSTCTGAGTSCKKTCASEDLDCYVLDNNGFIILSEKPEHTGMFFGQADGTIMDSLVQDGIYKKMSVHDYQGACDDVRSSSKDSASMLTPLRSVIWLLEWIIGHVMVIAVHTHLIQIFDPHWSLAQEDSENPIYSEDYDSNSFEQYPDTNSNPDASLFDVIKSEEPPLLVNEKIEVDDYAEVVPPVIPSPPVVPVSRPNRSRNARPCHKKVDLYVLQPNRLNNSGLFNPLKGKLTNCHVTGCERPFSVQKIPHSNLILLVVDTLCPCGSKTLSIVAQEVIPGFDNTSTAPPCRRDSINIYRRRPEKCINYHPEEVMIEQCGGSSKAAVSLVLISMVAAMPSYFS
nr:PREDICTED: voltage-dependent calcium channel subunit alpha-2/delta-3 isoform X2 [Bemisia tabaci]